MALLNGQRTDGNAELQRRILKRRQQEEKAEVEAMAERWKVNRGVAAALVPLLPPELLAHILQHKGGTNARSSRHG